MNDFSKALASIKARHEELLSRKNEKSATGNNVYNRYIYPVLTAEHAPLTWRYDFNPETNPYLMERIGVNATLNAGAMKWKSGYKCL